MEVLRLSPSVRRVTVLGRAEDGDVAPTVIFDKSGRKKKTSQFFRPLERAVYRLATSQAAFGSSYATRHKRSNRKKKDGWIRDWNLNLARAGRRGSKRLKLRSWLLG